MDEDHSAPVPPPVAPDGCARRFDSTAGGPVTGAELGARRAALRQVLDVPGPAWAVVARSPAPAGRRGGTGRAHRRGRREVARALLCPRPSGLLVRPLRRGRALVHTVSGPGRRAARIGARPGRQEGFERWARSVEVRVVLPREAETAVVRDVARALPMAAVVATNVALAHWKAASGRSDQCEGAKKAWRSPPRQPRPFGAAVLHRLVGADRLAELLARQRVGDRDVARRLGDPGGLRRHEHLGTQPHRLVAASTKCSGARSLTSAVASRTPGSRESSLCNGPTSPIARRAAPEVSQTTT